MKRLAKGHTASKGFEPRRYDSEGHILYYSILFPLKKVTLGKESRADCPMLGVQQ